MISSTQLTVQQRASVALQSDKARAELTALAASSRSITAPTNPAGRAECHAAAMAAAGARIAIAKAGKDARDDATQFSRAVIVEEARLIAIIQPEETRLKALRDAYDAEQARIKAEKADAERLRVLEISDRIARIKQAASDAARFDVSADAASEIHARVSEMEIDATFAEFYGDAIEAKAATMAEITKVIASKRAAEAAAKKAEETAIKDHLISKLQGETTGVAGKLCRVQAVTKLVPLASDWAAFWKAFNPKTDSDLVQKRVSVAAVQARWDAGEKVPGVDAVQIVDLSVSKL